MSSTRNTKVVIPFQHQVHGPSRRKMTDEGIQEAHEAFGRQVSSQVARVTGELNRLDGLLKAGRVDGRVLSEFRHAVDRVRTSGWQGQVCLEGDPRAATVVLLWE